MTHLAQPDEFDGVKQITEGSRIGATFYVPGEHDFAGDGGAEYKRRYGKGTQGDGWYSFDHKGVHFIGLVNVVDLQTNGLGNLGRTQLDWLKADLAARTPSTPIVVFAHIPLWNVYPDWGWGTADSAEALTYLKRFGSVTVLNGHIHQVMQKTEGGVTFHSATSTAFPQPKPGQAPKPGPVTVPADQLKALLGITSVTYTEGSRDLAIVDSSLAAKEGA